MKQLTNLNPVQGGLFAIGRSFNIKGIAIHIGLESADLLLGAILCNQLYPEYIPSLLGISKKETAK